MEERLVSGRIEVLILNHWIPRSWIMMPLRYGDCEICGESLFPEHNQRHHRNKDRMDDRTDNLQWVTWEEHRGMHKGPMVYAPIRKAKHEALDSSSPLIPWYLRETTYERKFTNADGTKIINLQNDFMNPDNLPRQEETLESPTLVEIQSAIDTLNRFYEVAPFGHGEIEHTVNALDEYRHRLNQ